MGGLAYTKSQEDITTSSDINTYAIYLLMYYRQEIHAELMVTPGSCSSIEIFKDFIIKIKD